jgi:2-polyprenyl-3-methyl-5-hydroxy-6-metoxy-1,4-benzoquinol methylase
VEAGKGSGLEEHPLRRRLERDETAALELYALYLGERLGLYRALADGGDATSGELATRTGTTERYVREWLEHQAVSGFIGVRDPSASAEARRYFLPADHRSVLVDEGSLDYAAYKGVDIVRAGRPLPELAEAFRTGGGLPPLPWEPEGRAEFNRGRFLNLLGTVWLPAIPDIDRRLRSDPPARVADIAVGTGWSAIAMGLAYPKVRVDGFDLDADAVARARVNAEASRVGDRVSFVAADAADPGFSGQYDLATIFEALHDMARPVPALSAARALLAEGGTVIVADELVGEAFTVPAGERERSTYGWSLVTCLPGAMGEPGTAATGAVIRPSTLRRYAEEAGFSRVEVLPIRTGYWLFYRLYP